MSINHATQPFYMQIRQMIQEDINSGKYKPDEKLPTEAELCEMYQVSRITIRKAIKNLVDEGSLVRIQGKGTFVTSKKIKNELLSVSGFSEFSHQLGLLPDSRILRSNVISASQEISESLQVKKDSPVLELVRLMYVDGKPLFYDQAYYSLLRFPDLEKKIGLKVSTYQILKEDYQTEISTNDKVIDVILANKEIADLLQCETGATLFRIEKTAFDHNKRSVHLSIFMCATNKVSLTVHHSSGAEPNHF
jgi:GntR family frlABCD operon transcriptional regulator